MPSASERLTAQFYNWEQRGRGWHYFDLPVDLEPHFHPFFFHYAPPEAAAIDDSKRHTIFSRIGELFKSKPQPAADPYPYLEDNGSQVHIFDCDEPFKTYAIYLPKGEKIDPDATQQLLLMLSFCQYPISFEIIGSSSSVSIQLVCRVSDAVQVQSQVKAYFPECIIKERADLLEGKRNGRCITYRSALARDMT